jgi:hypothetical protein
LAQILQSEGARDYASVYSAIKGGLNNFTRYLASHKSIKSEYCFSGRNFDDQLELIATITIKKSP